MGVGGYVVAVAMTDHHSHKALISLHHVGGLLLTGYAVLQAVLGLVRPRASGPDGTEKGKARVAWEFVHKKVGYVVFVGAAEQVVTGAVLTHDFGAGSTAAWLVAGAAALLTTAALITVLLRKSKKRPGDANSMP